MRWDGVKVRLRLLSSVLMVKNCLDSLGSRSKKRMTGLNSKVPVDGLTESTESPIDSSLNFFLDPSDVITVALAEKQPPLPEGCEASEKIT